MALRVDNALANVDSTNALDLLIDGVGPMPVVRPADLHELGDIVRKAAGGEGPLFPFGGGTQLGIGNPPEKPGLAVDLRGLDALLDYPARDMTVTVQAGIPVARLQEILAREKQHLPIDVPRADEATLGGVLAANVSGPRRLGYGTLRDYVIGISAVNDEGNEFKAGGRVVKNVAGYDMCKLLVGSLGTLGIITQVTLKLRPLPEISALVLLTVADHALAEGLDLLHKTRTRPVALELLDGTLDQWAPGLTTQVPRQDDWVLFVGFEGNREAVAWQIQQLQTEWKGKGDVYPLSEEDTQKAWAGLTEGPCRPEPLCIFKANLLPSGVAAFCGDQKKAGEMSLRAHAASGIVWGYGRPGLTLDQAGTILTRWRQGAAGAQGKVIVAQCPSAWKTTLNIWGPEPEGAWLMKEVKKQLDPKRVFNPGRFVAGI